jgi:small subunit ribosomal protein S1
MADQDTNDPGEFEKLLAETMPKAFTRYSPGDMVQARIVELGKSNLLLDVGQRAEGSMDLQDFTPEELQALSLGDMVEGRVVRFSGGIVVLSRALKARNLDLDAMTEASKSGLPVEGKVSATNKGGFTVDLPGQARGFVPFSQMDFARMPPETYVGQTFRFRVLEVRGRDVILSRTSLLKEEQAADRERLLEEIAEDQLRTVTVVKHETFGIFVDLGGGVNALVPQSEVSWTRGEAPPPVGTQITVKIMRVEKGGERPRISASLRQAGDNPWSDVSDRLMVGSTVRGKVTRLTTYGAFVELPGGLEGLLHISEISGKKHVRAPSDVLKPGQEIDVAVRAVDPVARRVSLSLKALEAKEEEVDPAVKARFVVERDEGRERRWTPSAPPAAPAPAGPTAMAEALRRAQERKDRKDH